MEVIPTISFPTVAAVIVAVDSFFRVIVVVIVLGVDYHPDSGG